MRIKRWYVKVTEGDRITDWIEDEMTLSELLEYLAFAWAEADIHVRPAGSQVPMGHPDYPVTLEDLYEQS